MENKFNEQNKTERKIDNLIDLVENHTRTERHLEQYSHIGNPEYKEAARKKQNIREEQIDVLKDQIAGNDNYTSKKEQYENLKENYFYGEGYIESNKEHMNPEDLKNLETRQQNRRTQMDNFDTTNN